MQTFTATMKPLAIPTCRPGSDIAPEALKGTINATIFATTMTCKITHPHAPLSSKGHSTRQIAQAKPLLINASRWFSSTRVGLFWILLILLVQSGTATASSKTGIVPVRALDQWAAVGTDLGEQASASSGSALHTPGTSIIATMRVGMITSTLIAAMSMRIATMTVDMITLSTLIAAVSMLIATMTVDMITLQSKKAPSVAYALRGWARTLATLCHRCPGCAKQRWPDAPRGPPPSDGASNPCPAYSGRWQCRVCAWCAPGLQPRLKTEIRK